MKDNNPTIADLSDPNRPERLSEQFREIYDNSWTDLLDKLNEVTGESDEVCVKQILETLKVGLSFWLIYYFNLQNRQNHL